MSPLCTELPVYSGKLSKNKKEAVGLTGYQTEKNASKIFWFKRRTKGHICGQDSEL